MDLCLLRITDWYSMTPIPANTLRALRPPWSWRQTLDCVTDNPTWMSRRSLNLPRLQVKLTTPPSRQLLPFLSSGPAIFPVTQTRSEAHPRLVSLSPPVSITDRPTSWTFLKCVPSSLVFLIHAIVSCLTLLARKSIPVLSHSSQPYFMLPHSNLSDTQI